MKSLHGIDCYNLKEVMEKSKNIESGLHTFHVCTPNIREALESIRASMCGKDVRIEKGEQFKVF